MKGNSIEEAKKTLDKFVTEHKLFNIKHSDGLEESIETLLTAYETEKEKNRQGKMRIAQLKNEITARIEDVNQYYTPNGKIKAKTEELDEEIKVKREIAKNPMDKVSGRLLTDSIVELEKTKKFCNHF